MSEAKIEAEKIVSSFRADLEKQHQEAHFTVQNNAGQSGSELNTKTAQDITSMNADFNKKTAAIEDALVDLVCKVDNSAAGRRTQ
jgi:hypothetical protein